ncbi:MAG: cytochrome c [Pseudomonadota bacterium]
MLIRFVTIAVVTICATAALAHVGVKNGAVMERMHNMKDSAQALSVLGKMDKGQHVFDADKAAEAKRTLESLSARVPALFEALETDPLMEARPVLWDEWEAFVARSAAMDKAIAALDVSSKDALRPGLRSVARACSACHEDYRAKK